MVNIIDFLAAYAGGNLKVPVDGAGSIMSRPVPSNNVRTIYQPNSMIAFSSSSNSTKKPNTTINKIVEMCVGSRTKKDFENRAFEGRVAKGEWRRDVKICPDYGLNSATWREHEATQAPTQFLTASRVTVLIDIFIEACVGSATKKRIERKSFGRKWKSLNHLTNVEACDLVAANQGSLNMITGIGMVDSIMDDYSDQFPGAEWEEGSTSAAASNSHRTPQINPHSVESDSAPTQASIFFMELDAEPPQANLPSMDLHAAPPQLANLDSCKNTSTQLTTNYVLDETPYFRLLPEDQTFKVFSSPCTRVQDIYFPQGSPIDDEAALANKNYIRNYGNIQNHEDGIVDSKANNTEPQDTAQKQQIPPKPLTEAQRKQAWFVQVTNDSLKILKVSAKTKGVVEVAAEDTIEAAIKAATEALAVGSSRKAKKKAVEKAVEKAAAKVAEKAVEVALFTHRYRFAAIVADHAAIHESHLYDLGEVPGSDRSALSHSLRHAALVEDEERHADNEGKHKESEKKHSSSGERKEKNVRNQDQGKKKPEEERQEGGVTGSGVSTESSGTLPWQSTPQCFNPRNHGT